MMSPFKRTFLILFETDFETDRFLQQAPGISKKVCPRLRDNRILAAWANSRNLRELFWLSLYNKFQTLSCFNLQPNNVLCYNIFQTLRLKLPVFILSRVKTRRDGRGWKDLIGGFDYGMDPT